MIYRICAFSVILILNLSAGGQNRVTGISLLNYTGEIRYVPDVMGFVVVADNLNLSVDQKQIQRDEIILFPGWPVSIGGSNERGGVYANLDGDEDFELIYPAGTMLYALNIDGTAVEGWPRQLDHPTDGSAAFGDIDGDGAGEIVVTTHENATFAIGSVYAFETDGTMVTGFPVATEGGGIRTPALSDLDLDGALEIVMTVRKWPDGFVYVFKGDGTMFPGWPQRMDYVPGSAAAAGDIDGDDYPEIIAESYYRLHAYNRFGDLLPGFPYLPGENRVFSYSTPVLADLDEDGNREIICGDHSIGDGTGAVHIVRYNGLSLPDWPRFTVSWVYGPPSVADIDGNGLLDVAVGDQTLSETPVNRIYAWTAMTGEALPGFPVENVHGINSQILLADVDGDGMVELITDDNTSNGKYAGFNHDGTVAEGWPLSLDGTTFFINPFVTDINFDGTLDISGAGYIVGAGLTNVYLWNTGKDYVEENNPLPILQYNTRRNGVFGDTLMVGIRDNEVKMTGEWSLSPNPARNIVSVNPPTGHSGNPVNITLFNSSGNKYFTQDYKENPPYLINLTGFPPGIYYLKIEDEPTRRKILKLIILPK